MSTATDKTTRDKILFTPGPLTTSNTVKEAMLKDYGSRDSDFTDILQSIRNNLLELAGVSKAAGYEAVLMQGPGTFGIESVISSVVPANGKLLVIINGVYGHRIAELARVYNINLGTLVYEENQWPDLAQIDAELHKGGYTHVAMVHCETSSGIINPVEPVGRLAKVYNCGFIVDAMSSFGAVPLNVQKCMIDFLISSANKCLGGVPDFSFIICKKESLLTCETHARTYSLDLFAQYKGLETTGQFRFTPPTQVLVAFKQALDELKAEGGIAARAERYLHNSRLLHTGMRQLGFKEYLPATKQGHIITTYLYPADPAFNFKTFYDKLHERGFILYPGRVTQAPCFRIGTIGHLFAEDINELLIAIAEVKAEMGF